MLQIIISPNNKYSLAESAQMAVEAGAMWLQLSVGDMADEVLRQEAADIVTLCRDGGVILTIENRVEMARELGLHGVFITDDRHSPVLVRQDLGPEAIVGTVVGASDAAVSMANADIDYVALAPSCKNAAELIAAVRSTGCMIPVVAYRPDSDLNDNEIAAIMGDGFSGICGGNAIFEQHADPVKRIEEILRKLS